MPIKKTAGTWDKASPTIFFLAGAERRHIHVYQDCSILTPVDEIHRDDNELMMDAINNKGMNLLIDSGIFSLAMDHARKHDCSLYEALVIPPEQIDGFSELWDIYINTIKRFGDKLWGYIEMDQGGRESKIKIRKKLEDMGYAPIPVYHPLTDGWDYFDELASSYDRICVGNVVHSEWAVRVRILMTLLERRQKYPHLWIHMLGLAPSQLNMSVGTDSSDATSWLNPVRFPGWHVSSALKTVGQLGLRYFYRLDSEVDDDNGRNKAVCLLAFDIIAAEKIIRLHLDRVREELAS